MTTTTTTIPSTTTTNPITTNNSISNEFILLNEINNYIESKEDIFKEIKFNEIEINEDTINFDNLDNFISKQEEFKKFFKAQLGNNIKIGDYYNTKITKLNSLINNLEKNIDNAYLEQKKRQQVSTTNQKKIDIEYNNITINKLYQHILLISLCIIIFMCCIVALNKYNFINTTLVIFLQILLILILIGYIIYKLYSKFPRERNDYYKFKFSNEK